MSSLTPFSTLTLFRQPFSFREGMASAFDYAPITEPYNMCPTPQQADAQAIASDFLITGNDLRAALADYAQSQ